MVEWARLESVCALKKVPRVRIPPSPPFLYNPLIFKDLRVFLCMRSPMPTRGSREELDVNSVVMSRNCGLYKMQDGLVPVL